MSVEALRDSLKSHDAEVRRRAVVDLRDREGPDVGPLLMQALGDEDWRVRKEAVSVVTDVAKPMALIEPLVQAICQGENVGLRNAALDVLEALGADAAPALINALPEVPDHARKFVVEALGESGGGQVVAELSRAAASDDANVAGEALEALARIGGPDAEKAMRGRLVASDPFLRMAALDGLNRLSAVVPWEELEPLLSDRLVRRVALSALGRTGRAEALPPLVEALAEPTSHAVGTAAAALVKLIGHSEELASDASSRVRALSERTRGAMCQLLEGGADVDVRRAVAQLLAIAQDPAGLGGIVSLASRDALPPGALAALQEWGIDAVQPLLDLLGSREDEAERAVAVELAADLAAMGGEPVMAGDLGTRVREVLRQSLSDPFGEVVRAAARCMSVWGEGSDAAVLVDKAVSAEPALARLCAQALTKLVKRAPEELEAALSSASLDGRGGAALAPVVAALGGPHADERLQRVLSSGDPEARRAAIQALGQVGGPRAAEIVALALADESPDVQAVAAQVLGTLRDDHGDAPGVEALVPALRSEPPQVRAAVARALGDTGDDTAAQHLEDLLRSEEPGVALAAVQALGQLKLDAPSESLKNALNHSDTEVTKAGLRALTDKGGTESYEVLAHALSHDSWDVRRLAAELLGQQGAASQLPALKKQLEQESDDLARQALEQVVAMLEGKGS